MPKKIKELELYHLPDEPEELTPSAVRAIAGEQARTIRQPIIMAEGYMKSANFVTGSAGWRLEPNGDFEGSSGTFRGTITATTGTIGAFDIGSDYIRDVANSFGLASTVTGGDDVRFWAGDTFANRATADFRVTEAGAVTASSFTMTGGAISGIVNSTATDISLLEATHDLVFSVTDADTIAWAAGTIVLSNGRTFAISAGNTGNMVALTYIYLDTAVSLTVLQTTTTYSTAMGANKLLVGTAQNQTTTASYIPFTGGGKPLLDGEQLGALSIPSAAIGNLVVTNAKINDMAVSKLSAGTTTSKQFVLAADGTGDSAFRAGKTDFVTTTSGFILGIDDSDSDLPKFYIGDTTSYFYFDGVAVNFSGTVNDIERTFGTGADGAVTISVNTTLAANKNYSSLTVNSGVTLTTAGYTIKCTGTVTVNGSIVWNGNVGVDGGTGQSGGGAGGGALSTTTLAGSVAGQTGGGGGQAGDASGDNGIAGTSVNPSVGVNGNAGGNAGSPVRTGGAAGTATAENSQFINNDPPSSLTAGTEDTLVSQFKGATSGATLSTAAGSGSGAGGNCTNSGANLGGAGGGSASGGGMISIVARTITVAVGGVISAYGGIAGNGGNASGPDNNDGGGGGGAGPGGNIYLAYKTYTNNGTVAVTDGAASIGGSKTGTGVAGSAGASAADGKIFRIQL